MRPYRGLTKDGKWVYGNLIINNARESDGIHETEPMRAFIRERDKSWKSEPNDKCWTYLIYEVIPETVGQSTGLHDKNGRGDEIYAGSLVWRVDSKDTYAVIWRKVHGQWWLREYKQGKLKEWATPLMVAAAKEYLTLCGNIHQNPELMESDNG